MALKVKDQYKTITASGGGTLRADEDESFLVTGLYCVASTSDTYVTAYVGGTTVGKFRVYGKSGNHLRFPFVKVSYVYEAMPEGLFDLCRRIGAPLDIPVASGETLTISRYAEAGLVVVRYDIYEAADIKATDPNGSRGNVRRYLHYGENGSAITASPAAIDTSLIWSGGDQWPFNGASVPERNQYRLLAVFGAPSARGNATANKGYTTHLQAIYRNTILADEDRNGWPFKGNSSQTADAESYVSLGSVIGPATAENPAGPLVFGQPLVFNEGDTLSLKAVVSGAASGGIGASGLDVALLLEHTYLVG
jgi:hypothetical protein